MLRVFINLLYSYTMSNNHYCSTYMMPYPHLMAKHCLTISRKWGFSVYPKVTPTVFYCVPPSSSEAKYL